MMTRRTLSFVAFGLIGLTLFVGLVVASQSATAAPPDNAASQAEHARVVEFWTAERIAAAVPRELVVDPSASAPGLLARPENPGGGGGNGGGGNGGGGADEGSTAVGGAPWVSAGTVQGATGKVLFALGFNLYVCSGTVVDDGGQTGRSVVLTAGHCVFDEASNTWATNWMFVPDFAAGGDLLTCVGTVYGCWTAEAYVTTTLWTAGDLSGDYAFAVMRLGGHNASQELDDPAIAGSQPIAFNLGHPTDVYAFGYPHAAPYDGNDLIYCAGTDQADTWGGSSAYGLKCDMTGGSSGGGWYANFDEGTGSGTLTSLNSFKYLRGPSSKFMFGPYFDALTQRTYEAALDLNVDTLPGTLQIALVY